MRLWRIDTRRLGNECRSRLSASPHSLKLTGEIRQGVGAMINKTMSAIVIVAVVLAVFGGRASRVGQVHCANTEWARFL